jgi:hypothetical protein
MKVVNQSTQELFKSKTIQGQPNPKNHSTKE